MLWALIKNFTRKTAPSRAVDDALSAGIGCLDRGDMTGARRHLLDALAVDAADGEAAYHLGLVEARSGGLERAESLFELARLKRDDADVNNALGNVRRLLGDLPSAAASYRHALECDEYHLAALANLGLTLRDQGMPQQALMVLERARRLAPDHVETLFNQALALTDLGDGAAAEDLIEHALKIDPDFSQARLQRAFMLLKRRDYAHGWQEYAWRVRIPEVDHWQDFAYPLWQGEALSGKRLLVQAEQGLGDQIMFASCLPDVLARAQHVSIECDPRLAKLFARSFPSASVYRHRVEGEPDWMREVAPDYRARCGDLPRMLRQDDGDFPLHEGYLAADPSRVGAWRERLAALGPGLNIGISWRGGTPATGEAIRSMALAAWMPILTVPGAHFVSLQYGDAGAEIAAMSKRHGVTVHSWASADAAMDDVAALTATLDLVITVCTTAAHLTGALGKRAWVLVPAVAEWRYAAAGNTMPWYPALRLFRQRVLHQWDDVIHEVKSELMRELDGQPRRGSTRP